LTFDIHSYYFKTTTAVSGMFFQGKQTEKLKTCPLLKNSRKTPIAQSK